MEKVCLYQTGFGEKDSECVFWKLPPSAPGAAPAEKVKIRFPEIELSCKVEGDDLKLVGIPQGMKVALRWKLADGETQLDCPEDEQTGTERKVTIPENAVQLDILPRLRSAPDQETLEKAVVLHSWKREIHPIDAEATEPPKPTETPAAMEKTDDEAIGLTIALKASEEEAEIGQPLEGTLQATGEGAEDCEPYLLIDSAVVPAEFAADGTGNYRFIVKAEDFAKAAAGKANVSVQVGLEKRGETSNRLEITPVTRVTITFESRQLTYNGNAQPLPVTLEPLPGGGVKWYHRRPGEKEWLEGRPEMTDAGRETWEVKAEKAGCRFVYEGQDSAEAYARVTMEILPKQTEITISARQKREIIYNGTEQTLEYELLMTPECPEAAAKKPWQEIAQGQVTGKQAGNYGPERMQTEEKLAQLKEELERESGGNYRYIFSNETENALTIAPRPAEITAGNVWKVYGMETKGETRPIVSEDSVLEGDRFNSDLMTRVEGAPEAAGTYATYVEVDDRFNQENYAFTWTKGQYVIFRQSLNKEDKLPEDFSQQMPRLQEPLQAYFAGMSVGLAKNVVSEDGQPHPPELTFKKAAGEPVALQEGADFEMEVQKDSDVAGEWAFTDNEGKLVWDQPGVYQLIVRGLGNYGGEIRLRYEIKAANVTSEPTLTPEPAPTSTPTVEPTPTAEPTTTAEPAPTVEPAPTAEPVETAEPVAAESATTEEPSDPDAPGENPRLLWMLAGATGLAAVLFGAVCVLLSRKIRRERRRLLDMQSRRNNQTIREA